MMKKRRVHCIHSIPLKGNKGVSEVIAYVLLIGISITIAVVAYGYLKGFVPQNTIDCPDGISLAIKDINNSEGQSFNVILQNNGRFNVDGYFIKIATSSSAFLANIDLSKYLIQDGSGSQGGGIVNFPGGHLGIENEIQQKFNLINATAPKQVCLVEITPIAYLKNSQGKNSIAVCTNAKIKQEVLCGEQLWECAKDSDCGGSGGACDTIKHKCINPVIWLEFDSGFVDSSPNQLSVSPSGTATLISDSYNGKTQSVLLLNGAISDYVRVTNANALKFNKNSFTVTAWVKSYSTNTQSSFLANSYWKAGPGFGFYRDQFYLTNGMNVAQPQFAFMATSQSAYDTTWHHVAAVVNWNPKSLTYYFNGNEKTAWRYWDSTGEADVNSNFDLLIGQNYKLDDTSGVLSVYPYKGRIDDIRIYQGALNQSQIQSIMNS